MYKFNKVVLKHSFEKKQQIKIFKCQKNQNKVCNYKVFEKYNISMLLTTIYITENPKYVS